MGIRDQINRRPGAVSFAAVLVVGLIITLAVYKLKHGNPVAAPDATLYFFYNPADGQLLGLPTPVTPTQHHGQELFRAHVYSCGECTDKQNQFIGYIEKVSPERASLEKKMRQGMRPGEELPPVARRELQAMGGHEISLANPLQWVDADSDSAQLLFDQLQSKCPQQMNQCHPGQ